MTVKSWAWKAVLALIGCVIAGYVFEDVIGGGALAWIAAGAILGASCYPLFKALFAYRAQKDAARSQPRS